MRKTLFFSIVVCLVMFFPACKKDSGSNNSSNYYIKANIGGTEKTFSANPLVVTINQSGAYSMAFSAGAGGSSLEGLSLQLTQNDAPITTGTYDETSSSGNYVIGGVYNPGSTDVSMLYGAGFNPLANPPLQIVISTLTDKNVSGTFSGEFFDNSGTGSNSLVITNGEFNLPIQ